MPRHRRQPSSCDVREQCVDVDDSATCLLARSPRCVDDLLRRAALKPDKILLLHVDGKCARKKSKSGDGENRKPHGDDGDAALGSGFDIGRKWLIEHV